MECDQGSGNLTLLLSGDFSRNALQLALVENRLYDDPIKKGRGVICLTCPPDDTQLTLSTTQESLRTGCAKTGCIPPEYPAIESLWEAGHQRFNQADKRSNR